ncbi:MAG: Fe-S cluster biogenesis protein NfuA [Paraglaciecola sp.]|jgi:Fe-S cluster biogenesis protein NfuA
MTNQENTDLLQQIEAALDTIRPHLKIDGGDVEVVEITDDMIVRVKWLGNCENCFMSAMTMKAGIEQAIKGKVPGIVGVEAINGVVVPSV